MASNAFRAASVYLGPLKIAEITSNNYSIMPNVSNAYGSEGVLGQNIGAVETSFDFDTVVPTQGMEIDIPAIIMSSAAVTIGATINGGLHMVDGRFSEASFSSSTKDGTSTGKFKFIGGAPRLLG